MGPTIPPPLLTVPLAYITTSLPDVQLDISLISYWQLLLMLEKGKQTACHTKVSTKHSLNKVCCCPVELLIMWEFISHFCISETKVDISEFKKLKKERKHWLFSKNLLALSMFSKSGIGTDLCTSSFLHRSILYNDYKHIQ